MKGRSIQWWYIAVFALQQVVFALAWTGALEYNVQMILSLAVMLGTVIFGINYFRGWPKLPRAEKAGYGVIWALFTVLSFAVKRLFVGDGLIEAVLGAELLSIACLAMLILRAVCSRRAVKKMADGE